jgi:hypothetical protein
MLRSAFDDIEQTIQQNISHSSINFRKTIFLAETKEFSQVFQTGGDDLYIWWVLELYELSPYL